MKLEGKVIVVTGGGNGMGRELVLQSLARGARVAAVDLNEESLDETKGLAGEMSQNLESFVVNITDRPAVEALPDQVIARFGAVDALINNAGIIQPFVKIADLDYSVIERVLNVNLYGTINMTKALLPFLLDRPEAHLVNISSMGGFIPFPGQILYGASKAAVKLFTEGLGSEMVGTSVRVTVVFPGAVQTNITANSGVSGAPTAEAPDEKGNGMALSAATAASIILRGIERNRKRVLVGKDAKVMDFLCRLMPVTTARLTEKMMRKMLSKA